MKSFSRSFVHNDMAAVVEKLRMTPHMSRAELGQLLGRTPATITYVVRELLDKGIVEEVDTHRSFNGRPRIPLQLNASVTYALAVNVGISSVTIAVLNFAGELIYSEEIPQSVAAITKGIGVIAEGIKMAFDKTGIQKERFCGVGISIPGIFNSDKGTVVFAPNLPEWTGMSMQELFKAETGLDTVIIENDAKSAALGELWFGAGKELQDFICVIGDAGIGAGFVYNREIIRGEDNATGEIGHMLVDTDNHAPICGCGNRGCLESVASLSVVRKRIQDGDNLNDVIEQAASYLGVAFSNLINIFSPQALIMLGPMVQEFPEMWTMAVRKTRKRMLPYLLPRIRFLTAELGGYAPIYGMAGLLFSEVLKPGWSQKQVDSSPRA